MEIKPHYVTYEIAKWLKVKGFDVPCRNYYLDRDNGEIVHEGFKDDYWGDNRILNWNADLIGIKPFKGFTSAPKHYILIEWLRVRHNIDLQPICNYSKLGRTYRMGIIFINKDNQVDTVFLRPNDDNFNFIEFKSPQEAEATAFEYIKENNLI